MLAHACKCMHAYMCGMCTLVRVYEHACGILECMIECVTQRVTWNKRA